MPGLVMLSNTLAVVFRMNVWDLRVRELAFLQVQLYHRFTIQFPSRNLFCGDLNSRVCGVPV